jgi:hypothetical protein
MTAKANKMPQRLLTGVCPTVIAATGCEGTTAATAKAAPQPPQNLFVEGFAAEQFRQTTPTSVEPAIESPIPENVI